MLEPLLTVSGLTMRFGGITAMEDINFSIDHQKITAIIGPNGAGKTTCFNCLTGFYKPTAGTIVLNNNGQQWSLHKMAGDQIVRQAGIVRTFQNIRLFSGMTVLENLLVAQHTMLMKASGFSIAGLLGFPAYRRAADAAISKAKYWLEQLELLNFADEYAGQLSYGQQRHLEIARALCTGAQLLCLDEPAAGLNDQETAELSLFLKRLQQEHGLSVLLIEHDMNLVMGISDKIIVLDHGQKIAEGTAEHVRNDPNVIQAYLGSDDPC